MHAPASSKTGTAASAAKSTQDNTDLSANTLRIYHGWKQLLQRRMMLEGYVTMAMNREIALYARSTRHGQHRFHLLAKVGVCWTS